MISRERVIRAIKLEGPDYPPVFMFNRDKELSDVASCGFGCAASFVQDVPYRTEWGYILKPHKGTMGQPEEAPLAGGWENWDSFKPPNGSDPSRLAPLAEFIKANPDRFKTVGLGLTGFNSASFIRGMTDFMEDLYLEPERIRDLLDVVFGFECDVIRLVCENCPEIDGFEFYDDWGTQNGLLVSPNMFRELFAPYYAEQFKLIHSYGKYVFFHSCGNVWDIIPDLIECGADILNLNQPDVFGLERLGEQFGGKVCFACPVDHQTVAITGNDQEITDYVKRLNSSLGSYNGGWIGVLEDYACCGMSESAYQSIKRNMFARG